MTTQNYNVQMSYPHELDEKTLATLMAISKLIGQSHSAQYIADLFQECLQDAKEYKDAIQSQTAATDINIRFL